MVLRLEYTYVVIRLEYTYVVIRLETYLQLFELRGALGIIIVSVNSPTGHV